MTTSSSYPVLAELGVNSPVQVQTYYLSSMNQVDVLRIVYDRPTGSLLTSSKTYKFPRVQESTAADMVTPGAEPILRTHPKLVAAVEELDALLESKTKKENIAASILNEIELLEEDIAMRAECLKTLTRRIRTAE